MSKPKEKKKNKPLENKKDELFCQYYVNNDDTFGNATHSYAAAFGYDLDSMSDDDGEYGFVRDKETTREVYKCIHKSTRALAENSCAVLGRRLLRKVQIQNRVNELFNLLLTDEVVDSELMKVIKQNRELSPKVAAIREFNAVKGRVINKNALTDAAGKDLLPDSNSIDKAASAITKFLNGNRKNSKQGKS